MLMVALAVAATSFCAYSSENSDPDPSTAILLREPDHSAQTEVWEPTIGGLRRIRNVSAPTITPFLPVPGHATGAAVIVAPGGGFYELMIDHEGYDVAKWLADHGVAAFVLKYRLQQTPVDPETFPDWERKRMTAILSPPANGTVDSRLEDQFPTMPLALEDARAAIRLVRARAKEWHIDPSRVGFMGFSAGAFLTLGMAENQDKSLRPDFIAPIYGPMGERTVPSDAPPMFIAIALDDFLIKATGGQNLGLITSWRAAGRPVEAHLFGSGSHGFGMTNRTRATAMWIEEFYAWMTDNGFLKSKGG
jgi:acetyl esterase/lipase